MHRRLRLVPVACACWMTSLLATLVPEASAPAAIVLWVLGGIAVPWSAASVRRSRRAGARIAVRQAPAAWRVVVVFALVASAAVASHVALAQPLRAGVADLALDGGRAVVVSAIVTGKIERRLAGDHAFDAIATRIVTGTTGEAARIDIAVRVQREDVDRWDQLDVGARIEASGTARAAQPGDRAVLEVRATSGIRVVSPPDGFMATTSTLRRALVAATENLPAPGAGLVPGLAVGDTSAVSAELDAAMKTSSLSHLTAVSGANCALVVGLAFGAAVLAGASRRTRVVVGLVALGGFVLLVTPEPSVVRAAVMAGVAMLGVLLGRAGVGMAVLSLSIAVLLIADPWLAGSLGFALSALATASLLLFARPLADGLARWMPRALALALSVPLAAQLACGPLLVLIAPSVPLYGVVANLLAGPAAPVATVVGLAACVAAPLPWLQSGLTAIAWVPAAWVAGVATAFSALPGGQLPWAEGWPGAAALLATGSAIGVLVAVPAARDRWMRTARAAAGAIVAVVVGVAVGGAALSTVAGRWTVPDEWTILACDVGQGDAVLVRSAGRIALIDTGPDPEPLRTCLSRVGVDAIDLLVLTHFDVDHVGGVAAVAGRVRTVLHQPTADGQDRAVLHALTASGAESTEARVGMAGQVGEARWRVLWPPERSRAFPSGNDASVVVEVDGGGLPASLFLGDLSASPQRALAASGEVRRDYDLVKVAHHGSADQDAALYETISARMALVTVGADNDYGHPRAETLDLFDAEGAAIGRTDVDGIVAVWATDSGLSVWREHGGRVGADR